jgi:Cd2+/Zn2+-exporting ATPase
MAHAHQPSKHFGEASELKLAIACGLFLVSGWISGYFVSLPSYLPISLFLACYFCGGLLAAIDAVTKLLRGRFEIDFLMIVAALGAAVLGEWSEGGLLLFLFSLGNSLENFAMGRARRAIEELANIAPDTAIVRRGGTEVEVAVEEIQIGETVIIRTNDRISADGFVIDGSSSVDQAPITGESIPVEKIPVIDRIAASNHPESVAPEHRVFAGTINQHGHLEIEVTKLAAESTLSRVVEMVKEAEARQSKTQRFTDAFELYFVPTVIGIVVLLLFAFVILDESFSDSFYRAMAVLVAASPCALAIATPSAVLSGIARAARDGVLFKGGEPLEELGTVASIAFDKTGTLTQGKPRITDVMNFGAVSEMELLTIAMAVEQFSDHPLAEAIMRDGKERLELAIRNTPKSSIDSEEGEFGKISAASTNPNQSFEIPDASGLTSVTGMGIHAIVDGDEVYVGKPALFQSVPGAEIPTELFNIVQSLERDGRTLMVVLKGKRYMGAIGLMDTPRDNAAQTIKLLRLQGIERLVMISGDNQSAAQSIASLLGLDEAFGNLLPQEKVDTVRQLQRNGGVAMVGDGVNDAPAMANSSVGIAMGVAGSDVALETADVALMADDLVKLPFAIGLSRQTNRIIRQNLWISLGMVAVLVPSAIFGLPLGFAVFFHEGSTVTVVLNALRLLIYKVPMSKNA